MDRREDMPEFYVKHSGEERVKKVVIRSELRWSRVRREMDCG